MSIHITGKVYQSETGRPVAGITVDVYDADVLSDDRLGRVQTDGNGHYRLEIKSRLGLFRERPDPYVVLRDGQGRTLKSTRSSHLQDIDKDVVIDVPISCYKLVEAGLLDEATLPAELREPGTMTGLSRWSFARPTNDALFAQIEADLAPKASLLHLLADYMRSLRQSPDNLAPAFTKMAKLFDLGVTPKEVEGHHYGVALGLRISEERRALSRLDNVIELLWGATLEEESPWVGKSFERLAPARAQGLTGEKPDPARPAFLGINHFNRLDWHPANLVSYHALTFWLNLHDASPTERATFAYDRNGGNFVAGQAPSVCSTTPREVFSLNYRWPSMHNRPPLSWLIDELVQIGDGLYLGQLLFATRKLLSGYDPQCPAPAYHYHHMGYFSLWDDRWNAEARRLFAFLEIPVTAPGLLKPNPIEVGGAQPFATLTCETPAPPVCNDVVFEEVKADLRGRETVLHLLKAYADELQDKLDNTSPYFQRLQELFNRGAPVHAMRGYYHGAMVAWHGAGLLGLFKTNALEKIYGYAARYSTWTGKRFDPISPGRLQEITDGFEQGAVPTTWGSNTQALRTLREKELGKLMELANVWGEPAAPEEAERFGYDLKNFFFIGHAADSLNPSCPGKRVYQINYRWPKLRTIVPDCFCVDELVEIARGLFLGQLNYATDWLKPYDPKVAPAAYHYGQFGYFLLMTDPWHQLRLRIGFDLDNG